MTSARGLVQREQPPALESAARRHPCASISILAISRISPRDLGRSPSANMPALRYEIPRRLGDSMPVMLRHVIEHSAEEAVAGHTAVERHCDVLGDTRGYVPYSTTSC